MPDYDEIVRKDKEKPFFPLLSSLQAAAKESGYLIFPSENRKFNYGEDANRLSRLPGSTAADALFRDGVPVFRMASGLRQEMGNNTTGVYTSQGDIYLDPKLYKPGLNEDAVSRKGNVPISKLEDADNKRSFRKKASYWGYSSAAAPSALPQHEEAHAEVDALQRVNSDSGLPDVMGEITDMVNSLPQDVLNKLRYAGVSPDEFVAENIALLRQYARRGLVKHPMATQDFDKGVDEVINAMPSQLRDVYKSTPAAKNALKSTYKAFAENFGNRRNLT